MEKPIKTRRKKITTELIVEDFKKVHNTLYDYSLVEYKTMHTKVEIVCKVHGSFFQTPNAHIRQSQNCPKCATIINHLKTRNTTENFIRKSKLKFKNRYEYTKTKYGRNAHEKVIITCKLHGDFQTKPNTHLSVNHGCKKCAKVSTIRKLKAQDSLGWTRSNWIKRVKGKVVKFYILRCWNKKEEFYKIGITSSTVKNRYDYKALMPYNYEIIYLLESSNPKLIYDLEKTILRKTKNFKYNPKLSFKGSALECRNINPTEYLK